MKLSWKSQSTTTVYMFGFDTLWHTHIRSHMHYIIRNGHDAKQPKKNPSKHTRCKRCLWNANVIKFGFHMGKSDWDKWTNTSSVDGMCAHTYTYEMVWMECVCSIHGNSNSAPGSVSDCETEKCNINWVMMKSGVNISLKLFDIATNINGMTLLNPFVTATMLNRSCIRAHSHPIFMLIFISYSSWKTTTIPFSCINSLSSVRFQYTDEHRLFHSIFRFLFGLCPISIYAICPLTSCKVCSKLMNNLWIDWNRLSFNEYMRGEKNSFTEKTM